MEIKITTNVIVHFIYHPRILVVSVCMYVCVTDDNFRKP